MSTLTIEVAQVFSRRFEDARKSFGHRWFTVPDCVGHGILHDALQGEAFGHWIRTTQQTEIEIKQLGHNMFQYRFRKKEDLVMPKPKAVQLYLVPQPQEPDAATTDEELSAADLSPIEYRHLCLRALTNYSKREFVLTSWIRETMNDYSPARAKDKPNRLGTTLAQMARDGLLVSRDSGRARKYALTQLALDQLPEWGLLSKEAAARWRRQDVYAFATRAVADLVRKFEQEAQTSEEYRIMIGEAVSQFDIERILTTGR